MFLLKICVTIFSPRVVTAMSSHKVCVTTFNLRVVTALLPHKICVTTLPPMQRLL